MARHVSTIIASVFRFAVTLRREGRRGRRIAIPAPIVRGLRHTGWDGRSPLRAAVDQVAWTGRPRTMGRAVVFAVPTSVPYRTGDEVIMELWRPVAVPKRYHS